MRYENCRKYGLTDALVKASSPGCLIARTGQLKNEFELAKAYFFVEPLGGMVAEEGAAPVALAGLIP